MLRSVGSDYYASAKIDPLILDSLVIGTRRFSYGRLFGWYTTSVDEDLSLELGAGMFFRATYDRVLRGFDGRVKAQRFDRRSKGMAVHALLGRQIGGPFGIKGGLRLDCDTNRCFVEPVALANVRF